MVDGLGRRRSGAEHVAVADAALVLSVVEVQRPGAVEDRPDRLARGGSDAALNDVDLLLQRELLRELRVELHVGLGVVGDDLDGPPEQAAGLVDQLDGVFGGLDHPPALEAEGSGPVEQAPELDRLGGKGVAGEEGHRHGADGRRAEPEGAAPADPRVAHSCRSIAAPAAIGRRARADGGKTDANKSNKSHISGGGRTGCERRTRRLISTDDGAVSAPSGLRVPRCASPPRRRRHPGSSAGR